MIYNQPENIGECEERIANLAGEESMILAQLNDPVRREMPAWRFLQWKSSALERKALIIRERQLLNTWRTKYYRERQETFIREKAARKAAIEAKQQQKQVAADHASDEVKILFELYKSLTYVARQNSIELNENTKNVLLAAEAILIQHGVFVA